MNVQEMMKQAKKMQAQMELQQKALAKKEFVIKKQGIELVIFGTGKVKTLVIDEGLLDPEDKDILEDLIVITFNEARDLLEREEEAIEQSLQTDNMPF